MRINRVFAMPSHNTHTIEPIKKLLDKYINGGTWLDPFARNCQYATYTNDLNPEFNTDYRLDFEDFLHIFRREKIDGLILDPPFSPSQIKEMYDGFGIKTTKREGQGFYWAVWNWCIMYNVEWIIQMGWHSNGRIDYYDLIELLLVNHGGSHHDTIVTVWKRNNHSLEEFV